MSIKKNDGTKIKIITCNKATNNSVWYVKVIQNGQTKKVWAKPITAIFKLAWDKFTSWSIKRTSSEDDDVSLDVVASSSTNSLTTCGAELKIDGYYGDKYTLTRSAPNGYSGLIEDKHVFELSPTADQDSFTFENTGGTQIKLKAPDVSVTLSGANVIATITNPNSCICHLYTNCNESEYAEVTENWLGQESTTYKHGHLFSVSDLKTKKGIDPGKTFTATWKSNDSNYACNYAEVLAWLGPADDTVYLKSDTKTVTAGTEKVSNSGSSGHSGPAFTGFGGTLAS